jgi:hypothetical protein
VTGWLGPLLALAAVGAASWFVVEGLAERGPARVTCAAHALMAVAMVGMFWAPVDVVAAPVGAALFAVVGAWFAADRLRRGPGGPDDSAHVVIGCAAMVVMYLATPAAGGHAGHAGHGAAPGSAGLLTAAVGLLFAGYFAWHAWLVAAPPRPAPPGPGGVAVVARPRNGVAAHLALDVLMAAMFLGAG